MPHLEENSAVPLAQHDSSTTSDWLRLSIMLLLLVIGRAVAPLHQNATAPKQQPAHLSLSKFVATAPGALPVYATGLYSTVAVAAPQE